MEDKVPAPSKGYQKQIKKEDKDAQPKPKANVTVDYSSPTAKKWPLLLEALQNGNLETVKQLIEEGINVNLLRDGVTPLMIAASKGHKDIAEALLQAGVNINEVNDEGWTALHKAAFDQADPGVIELLLQSGINGETKDKAGKTALNLAQGKGHREIVKTIQKHQAQLRLDAQEWQDFLNSAEGKPFKQQKLYDALTAYSRFLWVPPVALAGLAALVGLLFGALVISAIIGLLLGIGVAFGYFYFQTSIKNYLDKIGPLPELDIHTLRQKRKAGESIFSKKKETEQEPASTESVETSPAADMDIAPVQETSDSTAVSESTESEPPVFEVTGNRALVTITIAGLVLLILFGITFMYREPLFKLYYSKKLEHSGTPFTEQSFLAEVSKNNEEAVDLFIKAGINVSAKNEQGKTALMIASEQGHTHMLEKLIKLSAKTLNYFDKSGNTALMIAVRRGREQAVKILVEGGADVNFIVKSNEGAASALQAALDAPDVKEENMKILQYLLQRGADVKGRNTAGQFPLLFAADHGHTEAAKVLIEHGADVNDADQKGFFPLMSASCKGYPWFVTMLAEKGANLNMTTPDGNAPLMCAAREGQADTVKALLEKGVDVNAKTASGSTALTDAARTGHVDVVKLLLGRGADPGSGYLPDSFVAFKGKSVAVNLKKAKLSDVLGRIAKTASQEGYTIKIELNRDQKTTVTEKASWNKVLADVAKKNHLFLVVKEKDVFVLPYGK
jgi:ankyrin repeat protein